MKKEKLKYYVRIVNELKDSEFENGIFATLNLPNPSINPIEADKCLVKLLDQLRKEFGSLYAISLMAFSRDIGIHFHILFIDCGKQSKTCRINRWIKSDTIDADGSEQKWIYERDVSVSDLEAEIRERWPRITKSKPNKDSVYCCGFELWSDTLINYLARNEEKVLPREWRDMTFQWVHRWGIQNIVLKYKDSSCDEVNEQHPSAKILKIAA